MMLSDVEDKVLCSKFPKLSEAKMEEGVFVGLDIQKLLFDSLFFKSMNGTEKEVCEFHF